MGIFSWLAKKDKIDKTYTGEYSVPYVAPVKPIGEPVFNLILSLLRIDEWERDNRTHIDFFTHKDSRLMVHFHDTEFYSKTAKFKCGLDWITEEENIALVEAYKEVVELWDKRDKEIIEKHKAKEREKFMVFVTEVSGSSNDKS